MWLGRMHFRAPHAALKQINFHNYPNMQPIISYFQDLFKSIKRHLLAIFFKAIGRDLSLL